MCSYNLFGVVRVLTLLKNIFFFFVFPGYTLVGFFGRKGGHDMPVAPERSSRVPWAAARALQAASGWADTEGKPVSHMDPKRSKCWLQFLGKLTPGRGSELGSGLFLAFWMSLQMARNAAGRACYSVCVSGGRPSPGPRGMDPSEACECRVFGQAACPVARQSCPFDLLKGTYIFVSPLCCFQWESIIIYHYWKYVFVPGVLTKWKCPFDFGTEKV